MDTFSSLFFQVSRITFVSTSSFWIVFVVFSCISVLFLFFSRAKREKIQKKPIEPPREDDEDFESHALSFLKTKISEKYTGKNTLSHTARDIYAYTREKSLCDMIFRLEKAFYSSEILSLSEKRNILQWFKELK